MSAKLIRFGLVVLSAVIAATLALPSICLAKDEDGEDDSRFDFYIDPLAFEILFTDVDKNSSKFEEYRDMDSSALVRRIRLLAESADGNRTFDFDILNAARDDARYTMRYRNSGRYAVTLDYNIIPHRFGNDGTMLHTNASGRDVFTISDSTQLALENAVDAQLMGGGSLGFDFLRSQLQPYIDAGNIVDPRLERQRFHARAEIGKLSRWSWKIDLKQETRDGSRPYGSTFGFSNAIELPEPIRYDTRIGEFTGEWTADRGGLRFGVNVSEFSNEFETMTYDNPWRLNDSTDSSAYTAPGSRSIGGPSTGRNALAPDNEAARLFVSGHTRLGKNGWLNGNLSFGRMEQDQKLLPHTVNTAINVSVVDPTIRPPFDAADPANLPASSAGAEVDTLHFTANAGVKIGKRASVKARARYYDYDNKSDVLSFPGYVRMDAVWEQVPRITVPYAYTRQKLGVEFGFDPTPKTHLALGYDLESWDRDFREVESSDEDIVHFTVDSRALKNVTLRGGVEWGDRTNDGYNVAAQLDSFTDPAERVNNQFALRKYDEAEREYLLARGSAMIMVSDAVSVSVGASVGNYDYDDTVRVPDPNDPDPTFPTLPLVSARAMGLLEEEVTEYNAEVSYTPGERLSLFVFGSRTDRETFQRARQSGGTVSTNPLDDWELELEEATDTWGCGLVASFGERWTLDITGSVSDSDGDSSFFSPPGGNPDVAESFDEYDDNEWIVYTAGFRYRASDNVEASLTLQHDEFETNRFARMGLMPYLPGALILDLNDGDYDADLLWLGLRVSF